MCQVQPEVLIFMWLVVDVLFRVPRVSGSSLFSIILCPHILKPVSVSIYPKSQTAWPATAHHPQNQEEKQSKEAAVQVHFAPCQQHLCRGSSPKSFTVCCGYIRKLATEGTELALRVAIKWDCFLVREA